MKRFFRAFTLTSALVATVMLASLALLSPNAANAGQSYPGMTNGYYYGGGQAQRYSGYSYSPYGNGGYTYYAPRAYVYPTYRPYGYGNGYGSGAFNNGVFDHSYSGSGVYVQPYRPAYNPYGYGGYGPYGFSIRF